MIAHTDKARASLALLSAGIAQAAVLALRGAVEAAETSEKTTTLFHDKTGETRGSVRGQVLGFKGRVSVGGAAKLLQNGTKPHVIEAKRAGMLRFMVNGQVLFRRRVNHPGTAERPFVSEARERGAVALAFGADFYVGAAIQRAH